MQIIQSLVLIVVITVSAGAKSAEPVTKVDGKIKWMVQDYYASKLNQETLKKAAKRERRLGVDAAWDHLPGDCPPSPKACVDFVCTKLGAFGCDDQKEVMAVLRLCRGNFGAGCVSTVCHRLGSFGCDDFSEVEAVAGACRGNYDGECIEMICKRLGAFGCDDLKEILPIARECGGFEP